MSLYRSSDEKVIAGICAGIAHKLDLNVTGLRWVVESINANGIPFRLTAKTRERAVK